MSVRRILLIDPSLFSPLYAAHFARGMRTWGVGVTLATRRLRAYERLDPNDLAIAPVFYRLSERGGAGWRTSRATKIFKAAEHPFGWLRLLETIARQDFDVLHVSWSLLPAVDSVFLAPLARRYGLFVTVHNADLLPHNMEALSGRLGALAQRRGRERLLKLADGFVAHTDRAVETLRGFGVEDRRIRLVRRPPYTYGSDLPDPRRPRPAGPPRILFFGAIKPYKGADLLVDAALELAAHGRDFRLTVAGRPFLDMEPLLDRIRAAGAERHFAFELDYVPDERLDALLRQADIVVFPYREIDGSGAMALAASYGRAIVASRVGMFAEPPVADRVALVEPENVADLAATLDRLVTDAAARADLARRGAELARELGDWRSYARACLDFYETARSSR